MVHPSPATGNSSGPKSKPLWPIGLAVALLAIHAALAIDTLRQKSVTVDEVGHLPAGVSYWQKGTFELYHHNPPLVKLIAALPALAAGPVVDYSKSWEFNQQNGMPLSPWAFGWEFMYANAARYHEIYFWARLPIVALSVLAGVVIFLWAAELFGRAAGLLAVALWSFCPNVIAHAGLVTTDMGAASLGFVATYLLWRYLRVPNWSRALLAGLMLGLAELTKFSLVMLYVLWPTIGIIWIVFGSRSKVDPSQKLDNRPSKAGQKLSMQRGQGTSRLIIEFRRGLAHFAAMVLISIFVINLGYGFEGTAARLGSLQFLSRSLTRPRIGAMPAIAPNHPWHEIVRRRQNRFAGTWLGNLPTPLPRHYLEGFDEQKLESEGIDGQGYPVYLRGELRRTGWWWYYFYALAIKVPLGTWLLTVAALMAASVRPVARAKGLDEVTLIVPLLVPVFVMSFLTDINLGLRYVLPAFPFWFVLVSRLAGGLNIRQLVTPAVIVGALGWNVARCAWVHPHHLAYFNELYGGPRNGYRHLIDSNLDWGQDLLLLQSWLQRNRPGETVRLAYFGNVDPSILAASGRPLPFVLAPPPRLDDLRLVASNPDGELFKLRADWINEHAKQLRSWLRSRLELGQRAVVNDHPEFRAIALEHIGLTDGFQPGLYAISANFVAGLPFRVRDQAGNLWNAEQDAYGFFRSVHPIAQVGYSIFVYEVTEDQLSRLEVKR